MGYIKDVLGYTFARKNTKCILETFTLNDVGFKDVILAGKEDDDLIVTFNTDTTKYLQHLRVQDFFNTEKEGAFANIHEVRFSDGDVLTRQHVCFTQGSVIQVDLPYTGTIEVIGCKFHTEFPATGE